MEGSSQNRRDGGTWLEDTEPYRGARPRIRDFDRPVDRDLGATLGDGEEEEIPCNTSKPHRSYVTIV